MRDDDLLLDGPAPEFGAGVIGVCDVCGIRQAVIVLTKERFKLCVIDFLNKAWIKTDRKPTSAARIYRSERVEFPTEATATRKAAAIVLTPTKVARHPVVLVTPDAYGITTTLLDAAIRFAREGFEVLLPDLAKTDGFGPVQYAATRAGIAVRGGVPMTTPAIGRLLLLYADALAYLRSRDMVDPSKSAIFGASYGASLALGVAAQDNHLAAVALAYPMPVRPPDLGRLASAPVLWIAGSRDRQARRARSQLEAARTPTSYEFAEVPEVRHGFLSRDLRSYDLPQAEAAWTRILAFLKSRLQPPPPKPPAAPPKPAPPTPSTVAVARTATKAPTVSAPRPVPPAPPASPAGAFGLREAA